MSPSIMTTGKAARPMTSKPPTPQGISALSDEQFEELRAETDRLQQLLAADAQRRRDEVASRYEVLGKDATATCLRHRRLVRWMAAPTWWYHADFNLGPAETRRCGAMWNAKAPIVIVTAGKADQ